MSSRHPKKNSFVVDPSCWSSPLKEKPLNDKNFTTETILVERSLTNTSSLCHIDFGMHPGLCRSLFLTKRVNTFALWSSDLPCCEGSVKEFFQSLQSVAKTLRFSSG
ncbi:hypothetical protein TNIN_469751 [Trichonephila inaurata madagascariensis]|uniref:Uncharacterized protein n=1 Tax=Trichonephila inaurata madagascariensis TaxID=2747483 RepID=A0A8X7C8G4_9ARAC|nr:hypothetical protein TNIN_22791 [Trichonephila inaurata madagascariensis]GFY59850.1 hypothetical protein TNIN_469751 [Trichonephila inaurata madagascariensis]